MKLKVQIETMPDEWKNNGALREFFIDYSNDMLDASETIETLSRKIAVKSYIALLEIRWTRKRLNRFKRSKIHQSSGQNDRCESEML